MQVHFIPIKKTHDLEVLIDLLAPGFSVFEDLRARLQKLTESAVDIRYPGFRATKDVAKGHVKLALEVRARVRKLMKLSP
jgi:HEPN domain-containing protein